MTGMTGTDILDGGKVETLTTTDALRYIMRQFDGVMDVRLLPRRDRHQGSRDKAFVVLGSHDIRRDRRIIEVLSQLDRLDFDIVPAVSKHMIPDAARSILD